MDKPKPSFSVVMIGKNEARTLPRLLASLKEFQERGGEVVYTDTNSTDGSPDVARSLGCVVFEEGDRFVSTIDAETAKAINGRFVVEGEEPVVKGGDTLFDFSAARNCAAAHASNDWVSFADCDEAFTVLDLDKIEKVIADQEVTQCEYYFTFAHDSQGRPSLEFIQSKMYNRTKLAWTNMCHEVLAPL